MEPSQKNPKVEEKVRSIQAERKMRLTELSDDDASASYNVALELLAKDWLNESNASIHTRAYMVERLLPSVVMGLEKLLTEVSKRDIAGRQSHFQIDFNPINYLAQYLMRNNPVYGSGASAESSYCHTMQRVGEHLKRQIFAVEDEKLEELKEGIRLRRGKREHEEALQEEEERKYSDQMKEVFSHWLISGEREITAVQVISSLTFYPSPSLLPPSLPPSLP